MEENLKKAKAVLESWFDEKDYDIVKDYNYNGHQITLHYDRITVQEDYGGVSYPLRDVYVRFILNTLGNLIGFFNVFTATRTRRQAGGSYHHPHVAGSSFAMPCLGHDTAKVQQQLQRMYTDETFKSFLAAIKAFLEYDGYGRHHWFQSGGILRAVQPLNEMTIAPIMEQLLKRKDLRKLIVCEVTEDYIEVRATEELEKVLGSLTDSPIVKNETGKYFEQVVNEVVPEHASKSNEIFKGKPIQIVVKDLESDVTTVAHPDITKAVCEQLSLELTKLTILNLSSYDRTKYQVLQLC